MSGNRTGGLQAADTNRDLYGADYYKRIGAIGGKATGAGGFKTVPGLASRAGAIGGRISKRGPNKPKAVDA